MPFVQLSLLRGKPAPAIRVIADGVHQTLVEAFETLPKDRFQVIHQLAPDELRFDADYLDGHRTPDLVLLHLVAARTRSTTTKQAFYQAVVNRLAYDPGLRPQAVQLILSPNE
ncbi:MAG: tautomerase family protein [Hymenobacter sp.]|nr:MAG: tautomerase family protein [Hymenobacter sp.]